MSKKKKGILAYKIPLLVAASILLFFVGIIQLKDASMSSAVLAVDSSMVDLGEIPIKGGIVEAKYTLQNNGSEPITITRGETSCMCTEAAIRSSDGTLSKRMKMPGHGAPAGNMNIVIEPNETAELIAYYDPMAHGPNGTGPIKRDVMLQTNSKMSPTLSVSFQGVVIP